MIFIQLINYKTNKKNKTVFIIKQNTFRLTVGELKLENVIYKRDIKFTVVS